MCQRKRARKTAGAEWLSVKVTGAYPDRVTLPLLGRIPVVVFSVEAKFKYLGSDSSSLAPSVFANSRAADRSVARSENSGATSGSQNRSVSYAFEVEGETVWSPALVVGEIYEGFIRTLSESLGQPSGLPGTPLSRARALSGRPRPIRIASQAAPFKPGNSTGVATGRGCFGAGSESRFLLWQLV